MGIKEAVSKGFTGAKKNLKLMMVLFAYYLVFGVINLLVAPQIFNAENPESVTFPTLLIASGALFIFLIFFIEGGSIAYIYHTIKNGNSSLSDFIQPAKKYYIRLLKLGLRSGLIFVASLFGTLFFYFLLININLYLALAVASISVGFGIYYLSVYWYLASYAIVIDDQNVRMSIKTGKKIAKENILTFIGISLLALATRYGGFYLLDYSLKGVILLFKVDVNTQMISSLLSIPITVYFSVVMIGAFVNFYLAASAQIEKKLQCVEG